MAPVLCVGETLEEREAGTTDDKVSGQVRAAFTGLGHDDLLRCIVAYEPIWAIGTGRNATPDDANATIATIRQALNAVSVGAGAELRVLYGGSVKPGNIAELMAMPEIDGGLVGASCLEPDDFARIVRYSR
jgi:triosephosphate isomerase